ncbi:flagellar filament capping protein FliD [Dongia sp.]|uniref:flagellar filament capping protein FliD n=1 Tax=Dongia sp. TaxID=1977262 RepID=UPI0035B21E1A
MAVISATGSSSISAVTSASASLDTETLIKNAVEQRLAAADAIELKITDAEAQLAAYQELETLLLALSQASDDLRNPAGSTQSDAFDERAIALTASNGATATDLMGAAVEPGAQLGSYDIVVEQVATSHKIATDSIASNSEDLGLSGTFSLGAGDGTAVDIDVSADMSLAEIAAAINAESGASGVSASVLKVDSNSYILVLTAAETNAPISLADGAGSVLETLGLVTAGGAIGNELQAAQPAILTVDGIEITRSTNEIDDLIEGVTLYLYGADAGTTLTLDIGADLAGVSNAITDFVDAYNAIRDFILTQQATGADGAAADDAVLFGDSLLREISTDLQALLTTSTDDAATQLSTIGITMDVNNYLVIDSTALADALSGDLDAVAALFQFDVATSSADLAIVSNGAGTAAGDYTFDITVDADGNLTGVSVNGDTSLFTVTGNSIKGKDGTIFEGMTFAYLGTESASIEVSIGRGLAQRFSDSLADYVGAYAGAVDSRLTTATDGLQDGITRMESDVSSIERRTEDYRLWLTEYYGRIEAQINAASRLREQLQVLLSSDDD